MSTAVASKTGFVAGGPALAEALAVVGRVAGERRGGLPVLSGIRFEVSDDTLVLAATDNDLTAMVTVGVAGLGDGVAVIPAKLVTEVVRSLTGDVAINMDGDVANVSAGRSSFALRTLPAVDFPRLPALEGTSVEVEVAGFSQALRQVLIAASHDDNRPLLAGVLISAEADGLRMVATDSYRLALRDLPGNSELVSEGRPLLVPARALAELNRLVGTTGNLTVHVGEHDITFVVGNVALTSRLIAGEFPNYRVLIPPAPPNVLRASKAQLVESIKRVKLLASDNTTPLRLSLVAEGLFGMKVVASEVGQASEEVDAEYDGVEMDVAFSPTYLLEGVESVVGDEVVLRLQDSLKPAILSGVDTPEHLYLIMPIRA